MGSYQDRVPFSGIIRIRDMMYGVKDPYRLDQGDVSFDAPDTVKDAMRRAIDDNRTHYAQTTGIPRLLELLAAKMRDRNGIPIGAPDEVLVTAGGIHGVYIACMGLLEPGDEVIVPDPEWPPCMGNIISAQGVPVPCPLHERLGWRWDLDELAAAITPRTRAIYVNSPNNPTGGVLTRADLEGIAALAHRHDLWVFSDEAYEDVLFDQARHVSIASLSGMYDRTIPIYTFSKTYAMTGLRLGYVASRDPKLRERMKKVLFYSASNIATVVQYGGIGALEGDQSCVERFRLELQARRDLFYAGIADGGRRRVERCAAHRCLLRLHAHFAAVAAGRGPRLASSADVAGVALMGDGGAPDRARTHRVRAGGGFRRQRRGMHPLLLRARSAGADRGADVDGGAVPVRRSRRAWNVVGR
jgi:aspartate aminotransferase